MMYALLFAVLMPYLPLCQETAVETFLVKTKNEEANSHKCYIYINECQEAIK